MPATGIEPVLYFYNRILSPARLPVPPRRHNYIQFIEHNYSQPCEINFTQFRSARQIFMQALDFPRYSRKWAEVDSNHRSNLQQIYSLSPLATRESTHCFGTHVLTKIDYSTMFLIVQVYFSRIGRENTKKECDKLSLVNTPHFVFNEQRKP